MDRRRFLTGGFGATVLASLPRDLLADPGTPPVTTAWDSGQLQHLLPTVSDSSILIKASFYYPEFLTPPTHIDMREDVKPIEQHGFTLADFERERIELRMFKWDRNTDSADAIDSLEPFHVVQLTRPD